VITARSPAAMPANARPMRVRFTRLFIMRMSSFRVVSGLPIGP
jgi:hypothetical protein